MSVESNDSVFLSKIEFKLNIHFFIQVLDAIPDLVFIKDRQHRFIFINKSLEQFLGFCRNEMVGRTDDHFFPKNQVKIFKEVDERVFQERKVTINEEEITDSKGKISILETKKNVFETINGELILVGVIKDITVLRHTQLTLEESNKKLFKKAYIDALTGLPNRRYLGSCMTLALEKAKQNNCSFAVLFIDLDRFKIANDTFGHDVGDELLIQVSQRIKRAIRKNDSVIRMGGDEFVVLVNDSSEKSVIRISKSIENELMRDFVIQGHVINIEASIGIAIYPQNGRSIDALLKIADSNMYINKKRHR
ncbi:PAS domain S-box-containing protein/diguanylate cyclase (GGDEF) domain-containing protein [Nitrosomonas cryotolerans]|uniref:PAS domain S-box-containing protein/diguanylate cyclase (GGDEF) domain-containing protein n=1 Tax=Nitrosomonas cryotolerans ATCC 49181 TaxID=1131553 RepID=A0A1N6J5N2_9PROT|nr:GGDEF domain-containing protein [Nitrosomonas cryotolerans]SFP46078.1 PAS domain S-box-containing protein/diguanylate cyclase (GGDEF) domain-containing protein [Nitrosomonas cryotolerans]SIO39426.1 PAS domain S-box-containing protein/diguanylate cyclase (GGDEF) domain-containing protein [Nitrosomonas cryotolerans ATCC 49181]